MATQKGFAVGPQYVKGPQGNLIGVRGPVQMWPSPSVPPPTGIIVSPGPPVPVRHPPIIYPPDKPIRPIRPQPPIRVGPYPTPAPPIYYPQPERRKRHKWHRRHRGPRGPVRHPIFVKAPPQLTPAPIHVPVVPVAAPVVPVPTGKICPSWGWMVKTNEDGSETVVKCQPGLPGAPGLHGLEGITETLQGTLGPNWMLYIGAGVAVWYFLKRR